MIYLSIVPCEKGYALQHEKAHSILRSLLSELGYGDIKIKIEENGRPYTDIDELDFSISHSGNAVLAGVITPREIDFEECLVLPYSGTSLGIDLEEIKENGDLSDKNKLAKRFLSTEVSSIEEFYRLWTRNEAYGKMTGEGVISKKDVPCRILTFSVELLEQRYSMSLAFN